MHTPADQSSIDDKINSFMTRKTSSLWSNVSKSVTSRLTAKSHQTSDSDISYEPLEWHHTESVMHTGLQKAH